MARTVTEDVISDVGVPPSPEGMDPTDVGLLLDVEDVLGEEGSPREGVVMASVEVSRFSVEANGTRPLCAPDSSSPVVFAGTRMANPSIERPHACITAPVLMIVVVETKLLVP